MTGADFLQLDPAAAPAHGLADWLTRELRTGINDGRLPVGTRLPSTRDLAGQLGLSRGVVVEAFQRLADEGVIGGRRGAGTTVLSTPRPAPAPAAAAAPAPTEIDLSPGVPDLSAFPRQAWLRAERVAVHTATAADLGYGDPRGTPALRAALAGWLASSRGVRTGPDDLIVVNGVAQGLALLAQVLREDGVDTVGFEDPGSSGTRAQLRRWGMRVEPVAVDDRGLVITELARSGLRAVVATPAHQFPTGVVLAADRRRELIAWARGGGLVIEDDYDAEHRYDRPPVAALQGMATDAVAYVGSVSKTLAPALRLGWLVAPAGMRAELIERKRWSDITSAAFGQLALAELITSGAFEKHLRAVRARQRRRRDALLDALTEHLPQACVQGVAAGLHLQVTLPGLADDRALAAAAREHGVAVHPLSRHRVRPGPPGLVIGYAATTPDRLREAVRRLARLVEPAG